MIRGDRKIKDLKSSAPQVRFLKVKRANRYIVAGKGMHIEVFFEKDKIQLSIVNKSKIASDLDSKKNGNGFLEIAEDVFLKALKKSGSKFDPVLLKSGLGLI